MRHQAEMHGPAALPVLKPTALAAFVSAAVFGSVFLSVVASTTALVRHNADPAAKPQEADRG